MERSRLLGPLGAAARAAAEPAPAHARRGATSDAAHAPPAAGTAAFLADLLDLRGSVALAEALAEKAPPPDVLYEPQSAEALRADVHARLDELDEKLAKAGAELASGRASALSPARMAAALADVNPDPSNVEREAHFLWGPAADYLALRLERVLAAVTDLREEIAPAVAAISPVAARLERLDSVLAEVTRDAEAKLLLRLAPAAERRFARALARVVSEHGASVAILRSALSGVRTPSGADASVLHHAVQGAVDGALAIFRHSRMRVEALVEAAARTVSV